MTNAMTVKHLKTILANQPDDRLVVISRDPEGNSYSPCEMAAFTVGHYSERDLDFISAAEDEDEAGPTNALCLWPLY